MPLIENTNYVKIEDQFTVQAFETSIANTRKIFERIGTLRETARLAAAGETIGETGAAGTTLDDLLRGAIDILNMQIEVNNLQSVFLALQAQTAANINTIANLNADILALNNDISTLNADIATLNTNITTYTNKIAVITPHSPYGRAYVSGSNLLVTGYTAGTDEFRFVCTRSSGSGVLIGTLFVSPIYSGSLMNSIGASGNTDWVDMQQPMRGATSGTVTLPIAISASGGAWVGTVVPEWKNTQTSTTITGKTVNLSL